MGTSVSTKDVKLRNKETYDQPLLVRHGPLRDITGGLTYGTKNYIYDTDE